MSACACGPAAADLRYRTPPYRSPLEVGNPQIYPDGQNAVADALTVYQSVQQSGTLNGPVVVYIVAICALFLSMLPSKRCDGIICCSRAEFFLCVVLSAWLFCILTYLFPFVFSNNLFTLEITDQARAGNIVPFMANQPINQSISINRHMAIADVSFTPRCSAVNLAASPHFLRDGYATTS